MTSSCISIYSQLASWSVLSVELEILISSPYSRLILHSVSIKYTFRLYSVFKLFNFESGRWASSIVTGDHHTCALLGDSGDVICWGLNSNGQLGLGFTSQVGSSTGQSLSPVELCPGKYHDMGMDSEKLGFISFQ